MLLRGFEVGLGTLVEGGGGSHYGGEGVGIVFQEPENKVKNSAKVQFFLSFFDSTLTLNPKKVEKK